MGETSLRNHALTASLIMVLFLAAGGFAQGWSEYRTIEAEAARESPVIDIGDTFALVEGDSSIIRARSATTFSVLAMNPGQRRLMFDRESLGPIEVTVLVRSVPEKPRSLFSTIRDKVSSDGGKTRPDSTEGSAGTDRVPAKKEAPTSQRRAPAPPIPSSGQIAPPPIVAPPKPRVLVTPPGEPESTSLPPTFFAEDMPAEEIEAVDGVSEVPAVFEDFSLPAPTLPDGQSVEEVAVPTATELRESEPEVEQEVFASLEEMSIYALASDLMNRELFSDAIAEFQRLLEKFPRTKLRQNALERIGFSYKNRASVLEKEANRQRDLRRSGEANSAIDAAITSYAAAVTSYQAAMDEAPGERERGRIQLNVAQSLHGVVRSGFFKGTSSEDSPGVVVEYLKSFIASDDTAIAALARLGIAKYYRDLGNVRHLADPKDVYDAKVAYERAIEEYNLVIEASPFSSAAEEALIDLGRLYDQNLIIRHFEKSVWYYDEVVRRFPSGQFAVEAATRARTIKESYL